MVSWSAVAAVLAVASGLLAWYVRLGTDSGLWAYWPFNGVLLGLFFRRPQREWPWMALSAIAALCATIYLVRGNLGGGGTVAGASVSALQGALGAWVLCRRRTAGPPLGNARELAWFALAVVCGVPLATTPLSALAFARGLDLPFFDAWWPLFVGNSLSMLVFGPLLMQRWWRRREEPALRTAGRVEVLACQLAIVLLSVASFGVLGQWTQFLVLLYLLFPLLAWAALRSGPRWTAVAISTVATVSAWCTARGLGPFAAAGNGMDVRVAALQGYLAFAAFTALLLAAFTEQRRRAYADLALQGAVQRAFFESSTPVMVLKDLEGRYLMVNRATEEGMRTPRERLIGRHPREFMGADEAAVVEAHDQRVLERGEPLTFQEAYGVGPARRQMLVTRFPVRDAQGVIRYLGMIARDETVERELNERLYRSQRVELVGQLAAGLAHDLNNLLSVLVNNLALLRTHELGPEEETEVFHDMTDAGERAAQLTRRLMSFGQPRGARSTVAVDEALRALEPLLRALARGSVDVVVSYGAPGTRVLADVSELEQIILNLVSNARDAIRGEGRISISTELVPPPGASAEGPGAPSWLQVRVSDSGTGMDPDTLARIFQPFFTTKDAARGTGLGLYTTSLLVKQLGGDIHATSEAGRGSTFVVVLPVAR